ncbi:TetR/AcrR family transcriptional regulator [Frankia sp. R43]|uniref:TetR/AcrR family transcriptional regulator n=1 Tax=Frankia sp. R43 TaxID=269536 RepID=UPI000B2653B8|nr:TetR/AcrR family transcriptional regulator [Frankia sp. R43]
MSGGQAGVGDPLDRRAPQRGDQRRAAMMRALDELLKEHDLDEINVAAITAEAGVSRSAFYFYFEDKAACAAALGSDVYQEVLTATHALITTGGPPRERIGRTIRAVLTSGEKHRHLIQGMLVARQRSETVRRLWDEYRESFIGPLAEMIDAERAAGTAPAGPDSRALVTVLLELNERSLEQLSTGGPLSADQRAEALTAIWLRTIYGTDPDPGPGPDPGSGPESGADPDPDEVTSP